MATTSTSSSSSEIMTTTTISPEDYVDLDEGGNSSNPRNNNWYFESILKTAMTTKKKPKDLKTKTVEENPEALALAWKSDSCAKAYVVTFSSYLSESIGWLVVGNSKWCQKFLFFVILPFKRIALNDIGIASRAKTGTRNEIIIIIRHSKSNSKDNTHTTNHTQFGRPPSIIPFTTVVAQSGVHIQLHFYFCLSSAGYYPYELDAA